MQAIEARWLQPSAALRYRHQFRSNKAQRRFIAWLVPLWCHRARFAHAPLWWQRRLARGALPCARAVYDHVAMHLLFQSSFKRPTDPLPDATCRSHNYQVERAPYWQDVIACLGQRGHFIRITRPRCMGAILWPPFAAAMPTTGEITDGQERHRDERTTAKS